MSLPLKARVKNGKLVLDERPYTVVGVMPEAFRFPSNHDIWPALIVDPDDALGSARGAMLIAAILPQLRDTYGVDVATLAEAAHRQQQRGQDDSRLAFPRLIAEQSQPACHQ